MKTSTLSVGAPLLVLAVLRLSPIHAEPGGSQAAKPDFAKARQFIQQHMIEKSIPSISIAVARRGEILWEESFGFADREKRLPATPHTMYCLASVNKGFTATALMILQERKQLDLDRSINDYLSAAKLHSPAWNPNNATVRRVANHTAGLTTFNPKNHISIDETIRRYGVLFWPPGEQFDYSNLGFKILDEVVARMSGKLRREFFREEIFAPLGMTHASVGISDGFEKFAAKRYNSATGLKPPVTDGVYCSAHDLVRFGMFCLKTHLADQRPILSDAAIDAMYSSPVSTGFGKYSLGWSIDDDLFGYYGILAQGGTDADQAWLRLIPSEGIAVVALANMGTMSSQVVQEILAVLLPSYGEARAKAQQGAGKSSKLREVLEAPPAALVGNWEGIVKTYRQDIPLTLSVAQSGEVHGKLGLGALLDVSEPRFETNRLSGRMPGNLGVEEDAGSETYQLELYLYLRDGALKGAVVTTPNPQLPFWAELSKDAESSDRKR
jgi:CubicO group peptidase (beta-lactamase class C family)